MANGFIKNRFCLIWIIFFLSTILLSCQLIKETKELHYGIPLEIENKTDNKMLIVVHPILTQDLNLDNRETKQIILQKNSSIFATYYLGKDVDFGHLIICMIAWKINNDTNIAILGENPYLIRTFSDPNFKIGPEKYGVFAKFIIE